MVYYFMRNRLGYNASQMSSTKRDLTIVNSTQNSPFCSVVQNINAVEDCLEEFLPLNEEILFGGGG